MATTEVFTINASVGVTEYSITNNSTTLAAQTTAGVYQTCIDFNAMLAGDQYQITVYEKCRSASTQRIVYQGFVTGVQSAQYWTPAFALLNGWDFSLKKIAGTDRTIEASVRKVA